MCATCSTDGKCLKCRDSNQFNTSTGKCETSALITNCKVYSPDNKCEKCEIRVGETNRYASKL